VIRRAWAMVQTIRTAPPTTAGFILGAACLAFGGAMVKNYVVHQQALLGRSLAELAQMKRIAAQTYDEMEQLADELGQELPDMRIDLAHADRPTYPEPEDLDPVGRRFMADDGDPS